MTTHVFERTPGVGVRSLGEVAGFAGGRPTPRTVQHTAGMWIVAAAFAVTMAVSTLPTPLYVLYQRRDHFSSAMITVIFAAFAIGVVLSSFLAGHLSDLVGRRQVLIPALLVQAVSAAVFIANPSLPGLLTARLASGVAIGLTTATATAWLSELHAAAHPERDERRAQLIAMVANLGGIACGPMVSGVLVTVAPGPLVLPYGVFGVVLVALAVLLAFVPETRTPGWAGGYRPQRIAVPSEARGSFLAAAGVAFATFAVFGMFNSLVPSFLVGTLHESSHVLAGAIPFSVFASAAAAQVLAGSAGASVLARRGRPTLAAGLVLLVAGMWLPSLAVFVVGGVLTGTGIGLLFRSGLVTAASAAPAHAKAEVLAGFFLAAYAGLSVPVMSLGIATLHFPARSVVPVFVGIAAAGIACATRTIARPVTAQA